MMANTLLVKSICKLVTLNSLVLFGKAKSKGQGTPLGLSYPPISNVVNSGSNMLFKGAFGQRGKARLKG